MFKKNLIKGGKSVELFKTSKKFFEVLSAEEYLVNYKNSMQKSNVEMCKLRALPEASKSFN